MDFNIGELSRRSGVNVETIRYYEREGLIPHPKRTQAGRRVFSPQQLEIVQFIKSARQMLFSLEDIRKLLAVHANGSCSDAKSSRPATSKA
jgi:MerR family mercuric resistance operon transcriptional regulator